MSSASSFPVHQEASTYDELSMRQSMVFLDGLQGLKSLKAQLYSAAEYFELSYTNDDQKQIVLSTLKDYAVQALVNTIDHLGSMTYKVNDLLDEKIDEVSETNLRVSSIGQKLRTCQSYMDREGFVQQTLMITSPMYKKRYVLPVGKSLNGSGQTAENHLDFGQEDEDDWHLIRSAIRSTIQQSPFSSIEKPARAALPASQPGIFAFAEKRSVSPMPPTRPLARSGSLMSRSVSPKPPKQQPKRYPSAPRKSASMRLPEENGGKEDDQVPSRSKRLLKALLSRRKSKHDPVLNNYLDEY